MNSDAIIVETDYSYDDAHNRTAKIVTEQIGSAAGQTTLSATYQYTNNLNQLDQYTDSVTGVTYSYSYDSNGNRTTSSSSDGSQSPKSYHYDRENRLINLVEGSTALRTIDLYLGTQASGPAAYEANYLETGSGPRQIYNYAYDYRTRRVLRDESSAGGSRTHISFSGGTSAQEYTGSAPTPTVEYIRGSDYGGGIGGILYTLRSGDASFKHYNARGDVVAATHNSGSLTYQAAYEAYGKHGDTASSQEWGTTQDRQQANTKDEDPTGLLNEGFRYRDLETGTFIIRDPLGFVDGPNVYTYVVQNSWTKFDPLGLKFEVEGDYEEDDDGNRTYQDADQQQIWDSLQEVRNSDWYNQKDADGNYSPFRQMDDSDTVVNIESSARHSYFERAKDSMGRDTDGGTIHLNLDDLANMRYAMDGNGSISKQSMSLESVLVHEGTHAFDWNYNREDYKGDWFNFFEQPKGDWNHFPYHLEKRAVDQADSYRSSVSEPERRIYLESSNSVWKFLNRDYRIQRMFREQRDDYNSSVAPNQRVTREHFRTGNLPQ